MANPRNALHTYKRFKHDHILHAKIHHKKAPARLNCSVDCCALQAKTFLDNGVISEEQFLEMTRGQANLEEESDSILANMQKTIQEIDARLRRMEIILTKMVEITTSKM